jgi:hypothetical protein
MALALALARRAGGSAAAALWSAARGFASVGSDIVSAAPGVSLQKARSWDEGVATKFSTTSLKDIFHVRRSIRPSLPWQIAVGQRLCIDLIYSVRVVLVFAGKESGHLWLACQFLSPFSSPLLCRYA